MNDKVLITGSDGMVGSRFVKLQENTKNIYTPDITEFDLLNISSMEEYIQNNNITHIINFAAYTDVQKAENERNDKDGLCWKINVTGTNNIVGLVKKYNIHLIHISTDMVFSGNIEDPGPYEEKHKLVNDQNKLTWYGYTKSQSEKILKDNLDNFTILRITYPVRAKYRQKLDILRKPLKLYDEGVLYPLFYDQQITITYIDQIYDVLNTIIYNNLFGTFHLSCKNLTSPFEIVNYLIEAKYGVKNAVSGMSIDKYQKDTKNLRYPKYSGLIADKSEKRLGIKYLNWQEIVNELVKQNISYK